MSKLYENSGVSLSEANKLNEKLSKKLGLKSFAGGAESSLIDGFDIVTCCDGIGSKIIPLYEKKLYKTIATDLIAANLNDLVCSGAIAVGFLDYIAVNKLDSEAVSNIILELDKELKKYDCKLMGGETSEIGDLICQDKIDISGFAIGLVEKNKKLPDFNIKKNDVIIGLCSSGIHANGFSLVRKLYAENKLTQEEFEKCLAPSFVYYNKVLNLVKTGKIKACANITGGGILSNLMRSIPDGLSVDLNFEKIPSQQIFEKLKTICEEEFWQIFNGGVGFCLIVDRKNVEDVLKATEKFSAFVLGKVI